MEMLQQGGPQNQIYAAQAMTKLASDTRACHALLASGLSRTLLPPPPDLTFGPSCFFCFVLLLLHQMAISGKGQ